MKELFGILCILNSVLLPVLRCWGVKKLNYQIERFPVQMPTFFDVVCREGIYRFYNESSKETQDEIENKMRIAISKLMNSDDAVQRWWAFSVLFSLKYDETKTKKAPFFIADDLLSEIGPLLREASSTLLKNNTYGGCGMNDGIWGDVLRMNRLLLTDYNINVLGVF